MILPQYMLTLQSCKSQSVCFLILEVKQGSLSNTIYVQFHEVLIQRAFIPHFDLLILRHSALLEFYRVLHKGNSIMDNKVVTLLPFCLNVIFAYKDCANFLARTLHTGPGLI